MSGEKALMIAVGALGVGIAGFFLAPVIAAGAGAAGILGAAGTGTAIVGLSGAALTSASLAAVGGSVLAGTVVITGLSAAGGGCVVAFCTAMEDENFEKADQHLHDLATNHNADFKKAYSKYHSEMSDQERKLWQQYL